MAEKQYRNSRARTGRTLKTNEERIIARHIRAFLDKRRHNET